MLDPPVTLQGWIEGEPAGKAAQSKPAGNGNGNGHFDINDPKNKQLIDAVAQELLKKMTTIGGG
jgi:hypothetical protein